MRYLTSPKISFGASGALHATLLVWLAITAAHAPREAPKSLYDQEIRPYEKHIVWYNLREKLPDIKPAPAEAAPVPKRARAQHKFRQTLVSGSKDDSAVPQMILTEAPPAELPKPLPLPNVVAEAAPPPPRDFMPPPDSPPVDAPPVLPDSPPAMAKPPSPAIPLDAATPPPQPLPFQPPPDPKPASADPPPELPEAPRVAALRSQAPVTPIAPTTPPKPLPFHTPPPLERPRATAPLSLPESPSSSAPASPSAVTRIPRRFLAPPSKARPKEPEPAIAAPQPESFAIAGLDPAKFTEIPAPPASHEAGFSGAPEIHPETATAASNEKASLVVPSLTADGGVRDPLPTIAPAPARAAGARLLAELREPGSPHFPSSPGPNAPKALRVTSAPDPRMEGRVIYTMAIQMPNVTSFSGSWMVWFADRVPDPGAPAAVVRPPVPRHKVDPAYVRSAVDERIEGVVKLAAVIEKDGRVDQIDVLSGIDSRLDHSAEEALGKWIFEPALRDGVPIDVDAVFEVPFHLAPKPPR